MMYGVVIDITWASVKPSPGAPVDTNFHTVPSQEKVRVPTTYCCPVVGLDGNPRADGIE